MPTIDQRIEGARRHVADGRKMLERQRALIDHLRNARHRHRRAVLVVFEKSQTIFEADLDRIQREMDNDAESIERSE